MERMKRQALELAEGSEPARIEVCNETTLAAVARLANEEQGGSAVLNFASAKNPGGGFLSGSQAQEESLARSSALHPSQMRCFEFYETHREMDSCLYSDAMIISPECPIFRDDEGELLPQFHTATFITSAAPNAGAVEKNAPHELAQLPTVLEQRAEYVLAVAAALGYPRIVLGAWGCGVFRNDPKAVAATFAALLRGPWRRRFREVVFAVIDSRNGETFAAFERELVQR
jgi:uncharacterized protein (TIGR02452 family)